MKKYCGKECKETAVCDFCSYYHFNGIDIIAEDGKIFERACYTGKGYCGIDGSCKEPDDICKKYICFKVRRRKKQRRLLKI